MAFASLIIYAIAMLIRPHEWGDLIDTESSVVRNSLIICMLAFCFHQNKNLRAPQLPLMIFLTLVVFLSVVAAGWLSGGIAQAELFLRTAFVPFVLVSGLLDTQRKQHVMFLVIIAASMIMVINGYVQVNAESGIGLVGNPIYRNGPATRITYLGFFSDPNDLGMYLVMSLPVLFLLKHKFPTLLKPLCWIGIVTVLYGIYLSNSRGTLLATLALLSVWFWRKYGTSKSAFFGLLLSPALLFVMSRFREIDSQEESAQGRLDAWYAGFEMFLANPLFGVGQGAFMDYHNLTAHNSFVLAFAEMGLTGCLAWTALIVTSGLTLYNIAEHKYLIDSSSLTPEQIILIEKESLIALVLFYSLVAYMVSAFFLSRTYIPVLYLYIGMSAACLGRVRLAFPSIPTNHFFQIKQLGIYSTTITIGGIVVVYLIVKLFL